MGSIVKLVQFIIVSKLELDSRFLMQFLIAHESSSNCIFFSSPYASVISCRHFLLRTLRGLLESGIDLF